MWKKLGIISFKIPEEFISHTIIIPIKICPENTLYQRRNEYAIVKENTLKVLTKAGIVYMQTQYVENAL